MLFENEVIVFDKEEVEKVKIIPDECVPYLGIYFFLFYVPFLLIRNDFSTSLLSDLS